MNEATYWKEFYNEKTLYTVEPLIRRAKSWRTLDDIPDMEKATWLYFEVLAGYKVYMKNIEKDGKKYAKLYIVGFKHIRVLYVSADAVCSGSKYIGNLKQTK